MSAENIKITVLEANQPVHRETENLKPKFKEIGVDGVNLAKDADGLVVDQPVKVGVATADGHAVTKADLDAEIALREGNEDALAQSIVDEAQARSDADGLLSTAIGNEASTRSGADDDLTQAIADEAEARGLADTALDGRLDTAETDIDTLQSDVLALQGDVAAILANQPKLQKFIIAAGDTQSIFTLDDGVFDADPDNAVLDLDFFHNGRWQTPATTGNFVDGAWRKNTNLQLETAQALTEGEVVVLRRGTASGGSGGGGGSTDLGNITVHLGFVTPKTVGTLLKPADALIVKDKTTTDIWSIEVDAGTLQARKLN